MTSAGACLLPTGPTDRSIREAKLIDVLEDPALSLCLRRRLEAHDQHRAHDASRGRRSLRPMLARGRRRPPGLRRNARSARRSRPRAPRPWSGWGETSIRTPSTPTASKPTSLPLAMHWSRKPPPRSRNALNPRPSRERYFKSRPRSSSQRRLTRAPERTGNRGNEHLDPA
jgi:hypothetical protein